MISKSLENYIHNIIREYKEINLGYYSLCASDLPLHDKKIILTYVAEISECEQFSTEALFEEYKDYIQSLLDQEIDYVYQEDMYENRYYAAA